MGKAADNTGKVFGRLTALSLASAGGRMGGRKRKWLCRCECGKQAIVASDKLSSGHTKSCGCWKAKRIQETKTTHGLAGTPTYRSWTAMMTRCHTPGSPKYEKYGGRGIKVCERWKDFELFVGDIGLSPGRGYSLNRINNDGDYEPGNCHWATAIEQQNNKSNNRLVTANGVTHTVAEWSRITGINYNTLTKRLNSGVDPQRALNMK